MCQAVDLTLKIKNIPNLFLHCFISACLVRLARSIRIIPQFVADHPFFLIISHLRKHVVFVATVNKPTSGAGSHIDDLNIVQCPKTEL